MTTTYQVTAKRWEHGWELHIEGVGVTQSRGVADAEEMVRHYLELDGVSEPFAVDITFRAEDDLDAEIRDARRAAEEATMAQEVAAEKSRSVARHLADRSYKGVEIAAVLGVSKQRASQLVNPGRGAKRSRRARAKDSAAVGGAVRGRETGASGRRNGRRGSRCSAEDVGSDQARGSSAS